MGPIMELQANVLKLVLISGVNITKSQIISKLQKFLASTEESTKTQLIPLLITLNCSKMY